MLLKYASVVLTDAVTTLPLGFVNIHYSPPCLSCRGLLDLSAATQPLVVKQAFYQSQLICQFCPRAK